MLQADCNSNYYINKTNLNCLFKTVGAVHNVAVLCLNLSTFQTTAIDGKAFACVFAL
jgi:hypothetical protein